MYIVNPSNSDTNIPYGVETPDNKFYAGVINIDPSSGQPVVLNGNTVIGGATATDGVVLPIDSLAVTYSGGAPSTPNAVWVNTVTYLGNTYTQTYTFDSSGNLASITAWTLV